MEEKSWAADWLFIRGSVENEEALRPERKESDQDLIRKCRCECLCAGPLLQTKIKAILGNCVCERAVLVGARDCPSEKFTLVVRGTFETTRTIESRATLPPSILLLEQ